MVFAQSFWTLFGLAISLGLALVWARMFLRAKHEISAFIVSAAHLVVAAVNSSAPVRGMLDPNFEGYAFGLVSAPAGVRTGVAAGCVFLVSAIAALIAVEGRPGPRMWLVSAASAASLVNIGLPAVADLFAAPAIPLQQAATDAVSLMLICAPMLYGAVWAARRAPNPLPFIRLA